MKTTCPACRQEYLLTPVACPNCGYPFVGTTSEQARHLHRYDRSGPAPDPLKCPRLILYAMALISTAYHIFIFFGGGFVLGDLIPHLTLIAAYAVCAHNLPRNPLLFAAAPLVLFALVIALYFIVDPDRIYQALWLKLLMASGLLVALRMVVRTLSAKGELGVE